jgi:periplasmic divalent cation tolerance protein
MLKFSIIYITNPDIKTAKKIASVLLEKKLIACANIFPVQSMYKWNGETKNTKEVVVILKTNSKNWKKIKQIVKKLHPYKIPCIIKISAEANNKFADWINKEIV